jgi:hypothetical protein
VLEIDCFADDTRGAIQDFNDEYKTPVEYIKEKLDFIGDLSSQYEKLIPKWHNQPYYIELWTEKNAMVGTFRSILKGLDVRIVYNRGFDSITNTNRTYRRFLKAWNERKKVRILYFGDLDPSGDAMDEIINENMDIFFDVEKFREDGRYGFKRVGVLYEHIDKFNLPKNADPKVLAKLKEDLRAESFMKKYGLQSKDELFQIEIDALPASKPGEFKKMVLDEIKPFYSSETYDSVLSDSKHSEGQISRHVMKNVHHFIEQQNIKSFMESIF